MRIVDDYPPLFDEIDAVFNVRGKPVMFAWGNTIYRPLGGGLLPKALLAHEAVHCERQGSDVVGWWRKYIEDSAFRLAEELPAHKAELASILRKAKGPQRRAELIDCIARRLAAPLYGNVTTVIAARRMLLAA